MPRYVAFLRGINLGQRRPKMDDLRALFTGMGFTGVATFIASGNVIFDSSLRHDVKLSRLIESRLEQALGYEVDTFVRTRAELAALVASHPFPSDVMAAPENTIHCGFFREALPSSQSRALTEIRTPTDEFHVAGRELFWLFRGKKTNESIVWTLPQMRALKLPSSSMRNLTTLRKLTALYPDRPG